MRPVLVNRLDPLVATLMREFVSLLQPDDVRLRFAGPRRLDSDEAIANAFQCCCLDSEMIWAVTTDGAIVALLVAGEMLSSLVFDQYGWLGIPLHAVGPARLLGAALLVAGVVLIRF
jgi:hypothetical protein